MLDYSARRVSFSDDEEIYEPRNDDDDNDDFGIDTSAENPVHHTETMSDPDDNRVYMDILAGNKELLSGRCDSCSSLGYGKLVPERCPKPKACTRWNSTDAACGACWIILPRNPKLCDHCQRWNTGKHSCGIARARSRRSVHEILENKGCILCRLVGTAVFDKIKAALSGCKLTGLEIELTGPFYKDRREYRAIRDGPQTLTPVQEIGGKRKIKCKFQATFHDDGERVRDNTILIPLELYHRSALGDLRSVKPWRSPNIDLRSLLKAMATCEAHHADACQPDLPPLPEGVRLIDTEEHRLIRPDPKQEVNFVALSYVCAATTQEYCRKLSIANTLTFEEPGALKRQDYPRLIWDAIVLCADLGERYLWVDCLCIIQDDKEEKLRQIQAMDRIYSCAKFTIAVTADWHRDVGIPGIRTRPRSSWWEEELSWGKFKPFMDFNFATDVGKSYWNHRGWTYQEQCLSRRKILISNHRSFFSCQEMDFQENRGRRVFDHAAVDVREAPPTIWLECWDDYMISIEDYTARRLTYDADILHAFAGYTRAVAMQLDTRILFGLPERFISRALRFGSREPCTRRKVVEEIPSWSWAAWCGMVDFDAAGPYLDRNVHGCLVRFDYSDPEEGIVELWDEDWWFWDEDFPDDDQPCDAACRSDHSPLLWPTRPSYDWRECPHNRGEMKSHLQLDEEKKIVATRHPGSLVFNTTLAQLFLESKITVPGGMITTPDITIHDKSGHMVGIVDKNNNHPVPDWVDASKQYEIIIIAAGILAPDTRESRYITDSLPARLRSLWLEPPDGQRRSPWVLSVMIVKRLDEDPDVMERLGTGFVLMEFWKDCEPVWETVVLM
ncbi:hypothetical protein CKM354_000630100 [Cercospora kikuchii]|uniref:Heterokaryon incompatibility domain-containing protein n=1 Tax=Cercospora kikuchii TaxID=84275 RepID=A0A9P3CHW1_9PEZI|nr:uncharacterized protein CKM354_000630100 [Cercospora kikuchii]GIZ43058.1 hypothetical protein CKM354_000630100 [Cercospora kikuchii]